MNWHRTVDARLMACLIGAVDVTLHSGDHGRICRVQDLPTALDRPPGYVVRRACFVTRLDWLLAV
jgi:hypothetical protein